MFLIPKRFKNSFIHLGLRFSRYFQCFSVRSNGKSRQDKECFYISLLVVRYLVHIGGLHCLFLPTLFVSVSLRISLLNSEVGKKVM